MAYAKYYVYEEQISYDNGVTWSPTGNMTASGSPIEIYDTLAECEGSGCDCTSFTYSTSSISASSAGSVSIVSYTGCSELTVSSDYWITISGHSFNTDSGSFSAIVASNSANTRNGSITCSLSGDSCQTIAVTQESGLPPTPSCQCSDFSYSTSSLSVASGANSYSVSYTGCAEMSIGSISASWVTITGHSYSNGVGTIWLKFTTNGTGSQRSTSMSLSINGSSCKTISITQAAASAQYRTTSGSPYCSGVDKYVDVYSQVSYDAGSSWSTYDTTPTVVEYNSHDCGYCTCADFSYSTSSLSPTSAATTASVSYTGCSKLTMSTISVGWATVTSHNYSSGVGTINLSFSKNGTGSERSTSFTLSVNGSSCKTISITQGAAGAQYRTVDGSTYCDGYNKRKYVYSQVSYDAGETWTTTATTSSLVQSNSHDCGYRDCSDLSMPTSSLSYSSEGGSQTASYTLTAGASLTYTKSDMWISVSISNGVATIEVEPNDGSARSGSVTFGVDICSCTCHTVSISQAAAPVCTCQDLSITATSLSFPASGNTQIVYYTLTSPCYMSWTKPDWITIVNNANGYLSITAPNYTGTQDRLGNIVFSVGDYGNCKTIGVSQAAYVPPPTGFEVDMAFINNTSYEVEIDSLTINYTGSTSENVDLSYEGIDMLAGDSQTVSYVSLTPANEGKTISSISLSYYKDGSPSTRTLNSNEWSATSNKLYNGDTLTIIIRS